MAEESGSNGNLEEVLDVKDADLNDEDGSSTSTSRNSENSSGSCFVTASFMQKLIAEMIGTYFMIFAVYGSVVINNIRGNMITVPGISIVWGLAMMVVVYATGHISCAHLNPAVTIAFANCKRFPWKPIGELADLAIGATILQNAMFAGLRKPNK